MPGSSTRTSSRYSPPTRSPTLDGLCLPYFGGATLTAVFDRVKAAGPAGAGVAVQAAVPAATPGPAWAAVVRRSYADAVCWLGACLADALRYAHDRGVLHLDVKPSNVLLTADGTPVLLDFHLARAPLAAGAPPPASLGGTPGYMPTERLAAVEAVKTGRPVPRAVDTRADVFALGLVPRDAFSLAARVPPSLATLVTKATAADPPDRYPTAAALADDLRRHPAARPLRGVRTAGIAERWRKWRRRRPLALPVAAAAAAALIALACGFAAHAVKQTGLGRAALRDGTDHLAAGRPAEAAAAFCGGMTRPAPWPRSRRAPPSPPAGRGASTTAGWRTWNWAASTRRLRTSTGRWPSTRG